MKNSKTYLRLFLLLSIILFSVSLSQKAYCTTSICGDSLAVFILGFFGLFSGGAAFCWLANPLLFFSWITIRKTKISLKLSLLSTLIALSFLLFDKVIDDEAGHYKEIIGYRTGYWLWLCSNVSMLIGNLIIKRLENRKVEFESGT